MSVTNVTTADLRGMRNKQGLILLGCGGETSDWVNGINEELTKENILLDGTKFDSSLDRGEPTSFPLDRVIKGWTEGLQLMAEGAKYQFIIPSDLAYGPRGAGEQIGPNATLYFEVELLKVKK